MNYITLNNGVKMPQLGYGVYQVTKDECERCVTDALNVGHDTASESRGVFQKIKTSPAYCPDRSLL